MGPDEADQKTRNVVLRRNRIDVTESADFDTFIATTFADKDVLGSMRADTEAHSGNMAELTLNMDKAVIFDPKTEDRLR